MAGCWWAWVGTASSAPTDAETELTAAADATERGSTQLAKGARIPCSSHMNAAQIKELKF